MSWHFTEEKIDHRIGEIQRAAVVARDVLKPFVISRESTLDDALEDVTEQAGAGDTYKAREETVTLSAQVVVPLDWHGERVYLALELNGAETLVYVDGVAVQAIDRFHHDLLLSERATGGKTHNIALKAYTGLGDNEGNRPAQTSTVTLKTAELQKIDRETEALGFDMDMAFKSAKTMDRNSMIYVTIINILDQTTNLIDFSKGITAPEFFGSIVDARTYLIDNLYLKYKADPNFTPKVFATGHAHIDTAWLWRLQHTRQKIARTFTTALTMMERYPDYHFTCSQPQQYQYIKEDHPEIYSRIKEAVTRGQWETVGAMWVESDCNVVSGESLVRHFLYGQRFFQAEFGTKTKVVWLPDVFGYSAAFPQIVKKAGLDYFMTIKIFWNQINRPPYQTFEWEGIDGTRLLTHFSPLGDYNAVFTPEQIKKNWDGYDQKSLNNSTIYIYGYGDGGGGPTRQMLENAQRLSNLPGTPRVKLTTAEDFFVDLEEQLKGKAGVPRWVGELYLEYHRGTYTSQGRNKRWNRKAEYLLQTAEQTSVLSSLLSGVSGPSAEINRAWQLVLLNQFHDIIPGSSIHEVYEDSALDYQEIFQIGDGAVENALASIALGVPAKPGDILVYNPLSWTRHQTVPIPAELKTNGQNVTSLDGANQTLIKLKTVPSLGYSVISASRTMELQNSALTVSTSHLENGFVRVELSLEGEITSIFDKVHNREVIDSESYCAGNALLTFEDKPMNFDAWDIDIYYQEKMVPIKQVDGIVVVEEGPYRASVEITRTFGRGSTIRQRISLYDDSPNIEFDNQVQWQERQTLLKAAFPVTIKSPRATYDIQFGNIERPTHWNTSWDWARFEVCAHKWADLSEGDYGVALLSECKYGWDIRDNVMRLTLLKGAVSPDPGADLGEHRFSYCLVPHAGDWRAADIVRRAYEFNVPVLTAELGVTTALLPESQSLASVDVRNLVIETVKRAEDSDAIIVRLNEQFGQRGSAHLHFGFSVETVSEVNLLEELEEQAEGEETLELIDGNTLAFTYRPYDLRTFKVVPIKD